MITIHHLGVSQSDRIVWLMEELGLPYRLKWHHRVEGLAPPSYLALHPTATAPVIEDDGRVLAESAAIIEYVCHKYAAGRLTVGPEAENYYDYVYWMHFNNNVLGLFFARLAMGGEAKGGGIAQVVRRREEFYADHANDTLGGRPYLAGDDFTAADIMSLYTLRSPRMLGGRDLPNVKAWLGRIEQRPAFIRAMDIAGADARPPEDA